MLCSRCSARVTPVVAIDIDGTLGDYHAHFIQFAEAWMGKHYSPVRESGWERYDGSIPFKDWFRDVYAEDHTTFRTIKLAYRQGGMKRTMPTYPWAKQLVDELRWQGAEVWLTTTRPHERYDRVDPDTREWLRRWGIPFDGLIFDSLKYEKLSDRVDRSRVVAVLDDLAESIEVAQQIWGQEVPILRRTKYNQAVDVSCLSVLNLHEAYETIKARLDSWARRFGS